MARDRRFVDVFDFKSSLTSPRRERRRVGCCTLIPSVYWPYIMTQHRRAIAAFADGDALNDWQRSSKAPGPHAHLRSPRIRLELRVIIIIFQLLIAAWQAGPA